MTGSRRIVAWEQALYVLLGIGRECGTRIKGEGMDGVDRFEVFLFILVRSCDRCRGRAFGRTGILRRVLVGGNIGS